MKNILQAPTRVLNLPHARKCWGLRGRGACVAPGEAGMGHGGRCVHGSVLKPSAGLRGRDGSLLWQGSRGSPMT